MGLHTLLLPAYGTHFIKFKNLAAKNVQGDLGTKIDGRTFFMLLLH